MKDYVPYGQKYHIETLRSLLTEYRGLAHQEAKDTWFKEQKERRRKIVLVSFDGYRAKSQN
jgi:hypothetical protein